MNMHQSFFNFQVSDNLLENVIENYETPFFLYDSETIVNNIVMLKKAFHDQVDVFYSFKANPNISVCALMLNNKVHAEISSLAELLLAIKIGFLPENILFVGPGKSRIELEKAVELGIFAIVIENIEELMILKSICKRLQKSVKVALRINPNFSMKDAPLKMGGVAAQFGMSLDEILSHRNCFFDDKISVIGIHIYNGSRVLNAKSVSDNFRHIFALVLDFLKEMPIELQILDLGGGFGVPYFPGEKELDIHVLKDDMSTELSEFRIRFPKVRLIVESGRYLVGKAGSLFVKVLYLKESNGKKFAITDGGMNCHMAAAGIGSFLRRNFPISLVRKSESLCYDYTVTGPLCTPNDLIGQDVKLPELVSGDIIRVGMSGAYGPSASPGLFLSHGFPKELMIYRGKEYLVRKKDDFEDIFRNHINIFNDLKK